MNETALSLVENCLFVTPHILPENQANTEESGEREKLVQATLLQTLNPTMSLFLGKKVSKIDC